MVIIFVIYPNTESLCCIPETEIPLHVNHISNKQAHAQTEAAPRGRRPDWAPWLEGMSQLEGGATVLPSPRLHCVFLRLTLPDAQTLLQEAALGGGCRTSVFSDGRCTVTQRIAAALDALCSPGSRQAAAAHLGLPPVSESRRGALPPMSLTLQAALKADRNPQPIALSVKAHHIGWVQDHRDRGDSLRGGERVQGSED